MVIFVLKHCEFGDMTQKIFRRQLFFWVFKIFLVIFFFQFNSSMKKKNKCSAKLDTENIQKTGLFFWVFKIFLVIFFFSVYQFNEKEK